MHYVRYNSTISAIYCQYEEDVTLEDLNGIVAENIRSLRKQKKLSLEELARLSSVSKSMLAQIERGEGNPTLSTLWKIANGMGVPFNTLTEHNKKTAEIIRLDDLEPILENHGTVRNYAVFPDENGRHFGTYYLEVDPGSSWQSDAHTPGTIEFITVFDGELEVTVGDRRYSLSRRDSLYFQADIPHSYRNPGRIPTVFYNIMYNN